MHAVLVLVLCEGFPLLRRHGRAVAHIGEDLIGCYAVAQKGTDLLCLLPFHPQAIDLFLGLDALGSLRCADRETFQDGGSRIDTCAQPPIVDAAHRTGTGLVRQPSSWTFPHQVPRLQPVG